MQIYDNSRCKSYTRSKRIIGIPQKYSGTADHHRSAHPDNPCEEIDYIRQTIGKEPKLRGFELLGYSPNINYADASPECLTEVEENKGTVETKASTPSIPISMRRKYYRKAPRSAQRSTQTWM